MVDKNLQSELARVLRSQFIAGPERTARDLAAVLASWADGVLNADVVEVEAEALPGPSEEQLAAEQATRENNARVAEQDLALQAVEQGVVDVVVTDDEDDDSDDDEVEEETVEEAPKPSRRSAKSNGA